MKKSFTLTHLKNQWQELNNYQLSKNHLQTSKFLTLGAFSMLTVAVIGSVMNAKASHPEVSLELATFTTVSLWLPVAAITAGVLHFIDKGLKRHDSIEFNNDNNIEKNHSISKILDVRKSLDTHSDNHHTNKI